MKPNSLCEIQCKSIIFNNKEYPRKELYENINNLSKYLTKNFKSDSPFILLSCYNHIKTFIAFFAILKANKIVVILDPQCKQLEISEIIEKIKPSALIIPDISVDTFNYNTEIIFRKSKIETSENLSDVRLISFTNAEDGYLKGAMLTETNLLKQVEILIKTNEINKNSILCSLLPFSHLFGMMHGIIIPSQSNTKTIIIENDFLNIKYILESIYNFNITHVYSVPSVYYLISKFPEAQKFLYKTNNFYSGGISLPPKIYEEFLLKTGKTIREGYGLTEASPGVTLNYDVYPFPGSIGKPLPGINVKILKEDNSECKDNEIGEICVQGPTVFKGYYNDSLNTRKVLINGWLHTGDLGTKDKSGNIYFCGLKKNMINVGGINVYPEYLKRLIKKHSNVIDAIIYSEKSQIFGDIPCAKIFLKKYSQTHINEFKQWCTKNINNSILPIKFDFQHLRNSFIKNKIKIYENY